MASRVKKTKKGKVKRHKAVRISTCIWCGGSHSTSQHFSHGKGSFKRTHKKKTRRKTR